MQYMYHNGLNRDSFHPEKPSPRVIGQPWPTAQHGYCPIKYNCRFSILDYCCHALFKTAPSEQISTSAETVRSTSPPPTYTRSSHNHKLAIGEHIFRPALHARRMAQMWRWYTPARSGHPPEAAVNEVVLGAGPGLAYAGRGLIPKLRSSSGESSISRQSLALATCCCRSFHGRYLGR